MKANAEVIGSPPLPIGGLPVNGDTLFIDGTISSSVVNDPADWFKFNLAGNAPVMGFSLSSSHLGNSFLTAILHDANSNVLHTLNIGPTPGATATAIFGNFPAGMYFVEVRCGPGGDGCASDPDYVVDVEAVPEPLTMLGAGTAVGFGAAFKRQQAKKQQKEKAKA